MDKNEKYGKPRMYFLPSANNYQAANLFKTLRDSDTGLCQGFKEAQREKVQSTVEPRLGAFCSFCG